MTIENVYNGRDNINTVVFSDANGVLDFTAATRMLLRFRGLTVVADTSVDPTLIDYSAGGGSVDFNLSGMGIAEGEYSASLIVYDPTHADGQIVVHAADNALFFRFLDEIL